MYCTDQTSTNLAHPANTRPLLDQTPHTQDSPSTRQCWWRRWWDCTCQLDTTNMPSTCFLQDSDCTSHVGTLWGGLEYSTDPRGTEYPSSMCFAAHTARRPRSDHCTGSSPALPLHHRTCKQDNTPGNKQPLFEPHGAYRHSNRSARRGTQLSMSSTTYPAGQSNATPIPGQ